MGEDLPQGWGRVPWPGQRNHRNWVYTPKGDDKPLTAGIAAHSEGSDVLPVCINQARKFWKLRSSDGVSDHDFLNGNWS
ncbi:MAG: hypothetical protein KF754_06045 [Planctomycetes bacterium]|nr:hypothetical protein [Planctomycetota bacterium]